MGNLIKLSGLAALSFAMIVFGACGGGSGGGGGNYSGGGSSGCEKYLEGQGGATGTGTSNGTNNPAYLSCLATSTKTGTTAVVYTVTNGLTYYKTGTDTAWQLVK